VVKRALMKVAKGKWAYVVEVKVILRAQTLVLPYQGGYRGHRTEKRESGSEGAGGTARGYE